MSIYDIFSPGQYMFTDFEGDLFEFEIFDLISSCELLDDEFGVSTELYMSRS
jgi:hypothetical protein